MSFGYQDIVELLSAPTVLGLGQFAYDIYVDNFSVKQAQYDALISAGSLVATKLATNLFVSKLAGKFDNGYLTSLTMYLANPALNYFIYDYLTKQFYTNNNLGAKLNHSTQEKMIIPIVHALVQ